MGVQHQLGLGGGAGGEIEQQRVFGPGFAIGGEFGGGFGEALVGGPAGRSAADGDQAEALFHAVELRALVRHGDDEAGAAAIQAVAQLVADQQRGGGDHHGAKLHGGQHRFPQRRHVGQHQQNAVAPAHTLGAQPVGELVRPGGQLGVGDLLLSAILRHDPERRAVVAARDRVEVVERPVEHGHGGPAEIPHRASAVGPSLQQQVARGNEVAGSIGHSLPLLPGIGLVVLPLCVRKCWVFGPA